MATLSSDYTQAHIRLGYAATEHGIQADTVDVAIELVSTATTHRGLYVGATRGRDENRIHILTETQDLAEARDVLETVLSSDRADIPPSPSDAAWPARPSRMPDHSSQRQSSPPTLPTSSEPGPSSALSCDAPPPRPGRRWRARSGLTTRLTLLFYLY
jgi:hypothetical protein